MGKAIFVRIEAESKAAAVARAEEMCRKLLANPVTEDFEVTLLDDAAAPAGRGA